MYRSIYCFQYNFLSQHRTEICLLKRFGKELNILKVDFHYKLKIWFLCFIGRPRDGGGDRDRGPRNDRDRRDMSSSYGGGDQGGDYGNTYGLSPQFLENLGIDGPLHTR